MTPQSHRRGGYGTTLPQSSPQLVQAAFAVVRPFQSRLLCSIQCLSLGLARSHKPWAPAVDWQVAPTEMGVEDQM